MKKIIVLAGLIFIALAATIPSFAYNQIELEKFKKLNVCEKCDLSEAYLHGSKLSGANLVYASLYEATLSGADLSGADLSGATLSSCLLYTS